MLMIGFLLMVASGSLACLLVVHNASGGPSYQVELLGRVVADVSPVEAFLAGLALALTFCFGVSLITASFRRRHRMMSRVREAEDEADELEAERDRLRMEREQLEADLERERAARNASEYGRQATVHRRPSYDWSGTAAIPNPQYPPAISPGQPPSGYGYQQGWSGSQQRGW
ncbi:MAG: hypothetical protein ACRDPK_21090 [Carbonactinosporaceae bacterium]